MLAVTVPAVHAEKSVRIFDGKTFNGWEGNLKYFRIEQGAVVAGNLKTKIPNNEFLCTKNTYKNFILKLEVKLVGGPKANAGIQIRTKRIPNHHEVIGYQADMGQGWWGALYDESRRRRMLAQPKAGVIEKILKPNDWNQYEIRCQGPRMAQHRAPPHSQARLVFAHPPTLAAGENHSFNGVLFTHFSQKTGCLLLGA